MLCKCIKDFVVCVLTRKSTRSWKRQWPNDHSIFLWFGRNWCAKHLSLISWRAEYCCSLPLSVGAGRGLSQWPLPLSPNISKKPSPISHWRWEDWALISVDSSGRGGVHLHLVQHVVGWSHFQYIKVIVVWINSLLVFLIARMGGLGELRHHRLALDLLAFWCIAYWSHSWEILILKYPCRNYPWFF